MANPKSATFKPHAATEPSTEPSAATPVAMGGESLADRLAPHSKKLALAFGVIALLAVAVVIARWRVHVRQEKVTAAYVKALSVADSPIVAPDAVAPSAGQFSSRKARAEAALAALGEVALETSASRLWAAGLQFDARQLDKAQASFEALVNNQDVGFQAKLGLGFVAEAGAEAASEPQTKQIQLEQALSRFEAAGSGQTGAPKAEALYHQGRILHQLGRTADAQATLKQALESSPTQITQSLIEGRLGLVASELP